MIDNAIARGALGAFMVVLSVYGCDVTDDDANAGGSDGATDDATGAADDGADGGDAADGGGEGPVDGGDAPADGSDAADDGGQESTGCCTEHGSSGCDDSEVQACVCAASEFCCTFEWDSACVDLAVNDCGGCDGGGDTSGPNDTGGPSDTGTTDGPCCALLGAVGCAEDSEIESCVCAFDDYCCTTEWDDVCAAEATESCGADCDIDVGGTGDTFGDTGEPEGGCCVGFEGNACDDMAITDCVCEANPGCCEDGGWTVDCVIAAVTTCEASCPGLDVMGTGDCCAVQTTPGCGDADVQLCTCAGDSYCCEVEWDDQCVDEAAACGASC